MQIPGNTPPHQGIGGHGQGQSGSCQTPRGRRERLLIEEARKVKSHRLQNYESPQLYRNRTCQLRITVLKAHLNESTHNLRGVFRQLLYFAQQDQRDQDILLIRLQHDVTDGHGRRGDGLGGEEYQNEDRA